MTRENSFSDSDGRSLTPDLEDEPDHAFIGPASPTASPAAVVDTPTSATPAFQYPPASIDRAGPNGLAPPSGLPPSQSPSVLFKEPSASGLTQTQSAPAAVPAGARPGLAGAERFRASVRKVIHMHRGSSALARGGAGAEPGIDPRRASAFDHYGHLRERCTVELVDYSAVRASFGRMENKGLCELMADAKASAREPWAKVRWINVGGVSWDVVSALALKYDIHPLALEDVMHQRGNQGRSKADYYIKHLFIRVVRHILGPSDDEGSPFEPAAPPITRLQRSSSPDPYDEADERRSGSGSWGAGEPDEEKTLAGSKFSTKKRVGSMRKAMSAMDIEQGRQELNRERTGTMGSLRSHRKRAMESMTIEELKRGERVNVQTMPFFIFLFRDGTVISINKTTDLGFTAPIMARLRQRDTGLRATADPALLVQSLLDLIVDQALEVVDEYQHKILKLEHDILIKPRMKTVRYLHILSGDLTLHKRTLEPIKTLVYGLRRYDVDRCAALVSSMGADASNTKIEGFMSHKSKIYLADVHDHIDYIIGSLDMFSGISENLINYTFNMASYEMNEVMRRLTMATIIFLPLTLLTGYFGMNFEAMWSVMHHSDLLFWEIALPVMAVIIPLFMWPDFERMAHYCQKKWAAHKVRKVRISPQYSG
ncbi:hypothetical protein DFH11DRAFT_1753526 [Phellopilus nigrolimitatus]|nr:hypothetical protein DFH11DRAFT_1753526 [Phellopilus nigrolimitatus]